uniref:Uncharacterized protein n=1 Tax=Arundo donax TaxID=35708 RepID=A0A0A9HSF1_ARUDO
MTCFFSYALINVTSVIELFSYTLSIRRNILIANYRQLISLRIFL